MKTTTNNEFAQMGLAALLPGMKYMLELMQKAFDEKRDLLTALQEGIEAVTPKRIGRPPGAKNRIQSGWPTDPEERRIEMKRRIAMRGKKPKLHPRDPKHPGHDEWMAKMKSVQKKTWKNMTVAQRKARLASMAAGRKPAVKLQVAS
jgi:hypothetical protein